MMLKKANRLLIARRIDLIVNLRNVHSTNSTINDANNPGTFKNWREIPGPSSLPFVGPMLHFFPLIGSIGPFTSSYELLQKLHSKYGDIVRLDHILGTPPLVFLFNASAMEQVLRNENTMPERPGFPSITYFRKEHSGSRSSESTGLLTEDGEKWKSFRSIVNPVMLQPKTIKLYGEELDKVAIDMVERLKHLRNEKNMITENFEIEMNKWSLESVGVVALGGRIGCLKDNLADDDPARQLIQCVRDSFEATYLLDGKPSLWRFMSTKSFKKGMQVYEEQLRLTRIFINRAIEGYKNRKEEGTQAQKGVLEKLLDVDLNIAITMASDMLFAGVDTAAHTMIAIFYNLGTNPEKQNKLREELTTSKERRYLKACIKESMRLFPIASSNLRFSTREHNVMGYTIPKGIKIIFPHEFMSKTSEQFPKPLDFIPERWLVEKTHELYHGNANPVTSSPFGFGARLCIGKRIAELEMETFLARMIENFEVEWFGERPEIQSKPLNYIMGPYNLIFRDVK